MPQPGISDLPNTAATSDPSPSQIQTAILPTDTTANPSEINAAEQSSTPQPATETPGELDDEVQFIFSAPRRRKKKRRRIISSHNAAEDGRFESKLNIQKSVTPSEPPRRGTTGMVQGLESCHLRDIRDIANSDIGRTSSLPSVPPVMNTSPRLQLSASNASSASKPPPQFLPFAPFMSMPWWTNPSFQVQDMSMAQNDWIPMRPEDRASSKRKFEGEVEELVRHPSERAQADQGPTHETAPEMDGMDLDSSDALGRSDTSQNPASPSRMVSPSMMQNFCWIPPQNITHSLGQAPTFTPEQAFSDQVRHDPCISLQEATSSMRPNQHGINPKETVAVPARLVPEQSVSPRTQTVDIPRGALANQAQASMLQRSMITSGQSFSPPRSLHGMYPMHSSNQFQIPRSVPPQTMPPQSFPRKHTPVVNPPRTVQTYQSDIVRRPSLYKVPPWPSPASPDRPAPSPPSSSRSPTSYASTANSNLNTTNNVNGVNLGRNCSAGLQRRNMMDPQRTMMQGMPKNSPAQRKIAATPPRITSLQPQARPSPPPPSPPLAAPQLTPNNRKHSPNLIVDIAETCQENFPFAAIAERHQIPIQKVFDTFSAIIQLPLLRSASDNRRHGSLGKRRMKEFRDARKAMEKEMKEKSDGGGRARKKKGPEQPLLRTALLNNASRGKE